MKNVIVGTAGHVDHGKTTLLKALTGVDLDTLKEEQKRGITINPGYSTLENNRNMDIGIIDVPGHEKFVHNMLTSIGGVDLVLLLVSAEEGIMPQTREHFEIVKALGSKRGIVVLTKIDLVDADFVPIIQEEVEDLVAGSFLEGAPIVAVSAYTGENIDALRNCILDMAEEIESPSKDKALSRLPIDRVFTIAGHGTVITGTLVEGTIEKGDVLILYPKGKETTVRSIQVHSKETDVAYGGQRVALNLTLKKEDIDIGDVLAFKDTLPVTEQIDVSIAMFKSTERILKNGAPVHMSYGSGEVIGRVILFGKEELSPEEGGYGQIRLESPIPARRGDAFVLRFFSPVESIAGGHILEINPKRHKRKDPAVVDTLKIKETGDDIALITLALQENRHRYMDDHRLAMSLGFSLDRWRKGLNALIDKGDAVSITEDLSLHATTLQEIFKEVQDIFKNYHEAFPLETGMPKQSLRHQLKDREHFLSDKLTDAVIRYFYDAKKLVDHGTRVEETGFEATLTEAQEKQWNAAETIALDGGFEERTEADFKRIGKKYEQILKFMVESHTLVPLANGFIHRDYWDKATTIALEMIEDGGSLKLADFRDAIDVSRKYAVDLLDKMDEVGLTLFKDGVRIKA